MQHVAGKFRRHHDHNRLVALLRGAEVAQDLQPTASWQAKVKKNGRVGMALKPLHSFVAIEGRLDRVPFLMQYKL